MKTTLATILIGLALATVAQAQSAPDFKKKFWTPTTIALTTLDGAIKGVDAYATHRNLSAGGTENDPEYRPFVRTTAGQVGVFSAVLGFDIAVAYVLHRKGHERLSHAILVVSAANNGYGAVTSLR